MKAKLPLFVFTLFLSAFTQRIMAEPQADAALIHYFQDLKAGKKETVVAYGTSVTKYGYWVTAMQQWFDDKYPGQVTVINSGGPGQNSTWGAAQLQTQVLDHHPDLVFVEFGANDAHTRFKMPVEQGKTNLDQIVTGIRRQNPQAAIVLQTMNCFWDAPKGFKTADTDRPELERFYDNYRSYAREHELPLIEGDAAWRKLKESDYAKFQSFLPDGTHPDKAGSLEVTWPLIKALLEQTADSAARNGKQARVFTPSLPVL